MRIDIRGQLNLVSPAIREHTRRRLLFAIGKFQFHIHAISVRFSDPNGPKGGQDKCCKIEVRMAQQHTLFIEETAADLYAAIDLACERLGNAVRRDVGKRRDSYRRNAPLFGWSNWGN